MGISSRNCSPSPFSLTEETLSQDKKGPNTTTHMLLLSYNPNTQ